MIAPITLMQIAPTPEPGSKEVRPAIAAAYETGRVTNLLPDHSRGGK